MHQLEYNNFMRQCDKCIKKHYAKGFCEPHYKEHRDLIGASGKVCSIDGCNGHHYGLTLCKRHYKAQYKRNRQRQKDNKEEPHQNHHNRNKVSRKGS